ncbi:APC family permease [Micrococcus luteus]
MKDRTSRVPHPSGHDDNGVAEFGYTQTLERSLGSFHTFAAGVSFISILTGCFQLFYFGFGFGGPAYWWTWPMVFVGQLMVALCFAELAARYPVAGSVYNWAKRLGNGHISWIGGWLLIFASIFTLAGVALALQITLPQIWSGFQIIGDGSGPYDFALNGALLGGILIVFTTLVNAWGVKLMAMINSAGVFIELVAAVLLIVVLAFHINQPITVIFDSNNAPAQHHTDFLGAFLVASLASGFVMFGFDTASSLGEEAKDPKKSSPKSVLRAVNASFWLGGAILLFGILAAKDIKDPKIASGDGGLQYIVLSVLGDGLGKVFLAAVAIAIVVCGLAVHTAAIRSVFAMSRDNNLPFARQLSKVHPVSKTPVLPAIVVGAIGILILVVNVGQPQIFTVVTSVAVVFIYAGYLCVTLPMLVRRLRGEWPGEGPGKGYFSLGRWGLPVNIIAVVWGAGMALNLVWPREELYGDYPWGGVIAIATVTVLGFGYYWFRLRGKTMILAEHAAQPRGPEAAAEPSSLGPENAADLDPAVSEAV